MTEKLSIYREWTPGEYYTIRFTLEELLSVQKVLGMEEEFTEFITGLSDDSYSEEGADMLKDMYNTLSYNDEEDYKKGNCYIRCMKTEEFQTCYTVFRLWNTRFSEEEALRLWEESCICTLEDILED